ncbi:MAG: hypothetical protein CBARDCOR_6922, partial [uncultured Caballeronia sp.]
GNSAILLLCRYRLKLTSTNQPPRFPGGSVLLGENTKLDLGFEAHNRFVDTVERRNGVWKLVKRQSVYDMAYFTFPVGVVESERDVVAKYPREYAVLAYLLEKSGFPVRRIFATSGSELERAMKVDAQKWLAA